MNCGIVVANKTWKTRGRRGGNQDGKAGGSAGWLENVSAGGSDGAQPGGSGLALLSLQSWFRDSTGNIHCEAVEVTVS